MCFLQSSSPIPDGRNRPCIHHTVLKVSTKWRTLEQVCMNDNSVVSVALVMELNQKFKTTEGRHSAQLKIQVSLILIAIGTLRGTFKTELAVPQLETELHAYRDQFRAVWSLHFAIAHISQMSNIRSSVSPNKKAQLLFSLSNQDHFPHTHPPFHH